MLKSRKEAEKIVSFLLRIFGDGYGTAGLWGYVKYSTVVKNTGKSEFASWFCHL